MPGIGCKVQFKPIWQLLRCFTNIMIYFSLFKQPGFADELCGPLAIPLNPKLYSKVFLVEVVSSMLPIIMCLVNYLPVFKGQVLRFDNYKTPKLLIVLVFKLFIIFEDEQRYKYYLHVFFIELAIILTTVGFDLTGYSKIKQAWQITITDSLQKIAIFYEVTRTFCPNFAIYWFMTNLFYLCLSQIEAHLFYYYPASEKMQPIYPVSLYVKQDIYRLMIMTFVYFGLFSLFQTSTYGYGMLIVFVFSIPPLLYSINKLQTAEYMRSLCSLIIVLVFIWILLQVRVSYPHLFKSLGLKNDEVCRLFDPR